MNPITPNREPTPSTQPRKTVTGGSLKPVETKPKRTRKKSAYTSPPPAPVEGSLTPEKAYSDAAHHYGIGKEEGPPYKTKGEEP